jgi:hypothetical protein
LAAEPSTVIEKTSNGECVPHMFSCQCKSHRPARWRNIVAREGTVIETGTVRGRCMRYDHCIDPHTDNFLFDKLMFASLNDAEPISVIVSVATLDIVVVIIADFTV